MIFLSHSGEDSGPAKVLADTLRAAGLEVWLDLDRLLPGDTWMESLEEGLRQATGFVVYVGRAGIQTWVGREVRTALDRSAKEPDFRVVPVLGPGSDPEALPAFLAQHQWVDLREGPVDGGELKQLIQRALEPRQEARPVLPPDEAPFRGLLTFDVEHSHLFFGRDGETEDLLGRLREDRFLTVVGDSGSGKSSLVRAALIPALHQGRFHDGGSWAPSWRIAVFRPGEHPFRGLADGLQDLEPELARADRAAQRIELRATLAEELREGTDGLRRIVGAVVPAKTRTLVVVDQFEEIFAEGVAAEERQRFIDTLLDAAGSGDDRPVHVVATLRADFYPACLRHAELAEKLAANQYIVQRVERDGLRQVIERPLALAGARAEHGLVEVIVREVGAEPGNLALLEHALLQLWENRSGRELTHEGYEAIGRIDGALEHQAEEVFFKLSEPERAVARRIFLRLTRAAKDALDTRRRAPQAVLVEAAGKTELVARVLRRLVAAHLIVGTGAGDSPEPEYEVAHEALIRSWSRLRGWLDEDREFLLWRERLGAAAKEWERTERDPEALHRGALLAEAGRWREERPDDLAPGETSFIDAGLGAERSRKRWRRLAYALTLVGVLGFSAVIYYQAHQQRKAAQRDRSQGLLLAAAAIGERDPLIGALLFAEVPAEHESSRAPGMVRELLAGSPYIPRALLRGYDAIAEVHFLGDCASPPVELGRPGPIPEGCRVETVDEFGKVSRRRADGRGEPTPGESRGSPKPDERLELEEGRARFRPSPAAEPLPLPPGEEGKVNAADVSSDGAIVVTGAEDGLARLSWLDREGRSLARTQVLRGHDAPLRAVAFSAGGSLVATADASSVRIWSVEPLAEPAAVSKAIEGRIPSFDVSADGRIVTARSRPSEIRARPIELPLLRDPEEVIRVAFVDDATVIRVTNREVWTEPADGSDEPRRLGPRPEQGIEGAAIDRKSGRVALVIEGGRSLEVRAKAGESERPALDASEFRSPVSRVALAADGRLLASFESQQIALWPREADASPLTWQERSKVTSVDFDPASDRVLTASEDGSATLWSARDGEELHRLQAARGALRQASFCPTGRFILTVEEGPTLRVFETSVDYRQVDELSAAPGTKVLQAAFDSECRFVYAAFWDGRQTEIWRWRFGWQALRSLLRDHSTASLTKEERARLLGD